MIKVLFIAVYSEPVQMVGGFRMYVELCKRLKNENIEVYSLVNLQVPTRVGKQLKFSYPALSKPRHLWLYVAILKTFISAHIAISRIKPHFIICNGVDILNNIATLAIKLTTKIPVIFIFHHWSGGYKISETNRLLRNTRRGWFLTSLELWFVRLFLRLSTYVLTLSSFSAEQLRKLGVRKEKIAIIGAGIDYEKVRKVKARKKNFDGVFIGRMSVEKGVFDLIPIWKKIVEKKPNAKLVVIGAEAPLKDKWLKEIKKNDLDKNIIYLGAIKDDETVYKVLKSAKVLVFPSHIEGFSIAVGEALIAGLPVVCWDIPTLREVYGRCLSVKFIPKGDINKFSEEVYHLLKDKNYRFALRSEGQKYASRFSWDSVVYKFAQILKTLNEEAKN